MVQPTIVEPIIEKLNESCSSVSEQVINKTEHE